MTLVAAVSGEIELAALERELAGMAGKDLLTSMPHWVARCLKLPRTLSPERRIGLMLDAAGQIYLQQPTSDALGLATEAESLASDAGDKHQLRRARTIRALLLSGLGNQAVALDCLRKALGIADELNDPIGKVTVWVNAAVVLSAANLPEDAIRCYGAARDETDRLPQGMRAISEPRMWQGIALSRLHLHDFRACLEDCDRAEALLADATDLELVQLRTLNCCTHARALVAVGRYREAVEMARKAEELANLCDSMRARTEARAVGALVLICIGRVQTGLLQLATVLAEPGIDAGGKSDLLRIAIAAYEYAGRPDQALGAYKELMRLVQQSRVEAIRARLESPLRASDEQSARPNSATHEPFGDDRQGPSLVDLASRARQALTRTRLSFAKI